MIRIALVGWADADWRTYRQEQWMAEVRRAPEAAQHPRVHFDIEEAAYRALVADWGEGGSGASRESATARLADAGAVEVVRR